MDSKITNMENGGGVIEGGSSRHHTGKIVYRGARGDRIDGGVVVTRNAQILRPYDSQQLLNHSPDGFNWGYSGSGPAQLALALLLDATGDPGIALTQHQNFKRAVVADFGDEWEITQEEIITWVNSLLKDQGSELERAIRSYRGVGR
jgi:hypothetical protein